MAGFKTRTVRPSPETAAMLFWALIVSGQITMRKCQDKPYPQAKRKTAPGGRLQINAPFSQTPCKC